MSVAIRIQAEPFNVNVETGIILEAKANVGALVAFTGLCRDEGGRLAALELEHYSGMAEAEITRLALQATSRWPLLGLTVIHRFGKISPGEEIVLVLAASTHRHHAFETAEFLMDFLKTHAPFWKREHLSDGTMGGWIEAKDADKRAMGRWV
jgi:molybdopterin synthase catalytic subunit